MGYDTKQELPEGFTPLGEDGIGSPLAQPEAESDNAPKLHYPELHFSGEHAEHLKTFPKHGTATIHFKKIHEATTTRHEGGKDHTHHSVGLQIHGIKHHGTEHQSEAKESRHTAPSHEAEEAIEKGLSAAETTE
jgi:hypothetical protein